MTKKLKKHKLKCTTCKVSKEDLLNFIIKNDLDNNYLKMKDLLPGIIVFSDQVKKNPAMYSRIFSAVFNSDIYFCSEKCYKIYIIKE